MYFIQNLDEDAETIARKAAIAALKEREWRLKERDEIALVLESDVAMAVWARQMSESQCPPFVRAGVYNDRIDSRREFRIFREYYGDDPRRPVVMRGAKYFLIERYGKNGYPAHVVERYLRIIKYTCFDDAKHDDMKQRIKAWAAKRHEISYHFQQEPFFCRLGPTSYNDTVLCWLNGEHEYLSWADYRKIKLQHAKKNVALRVAASQPRRKLNKREANREARILARALYELGIVKPGETA